MAIEKVNDEINLEIEPNSAQEIDAPVMEGDALMLEDEGSPEMHVIEVEDDVMIKTCDLHDYKYTVISTNDVVIPPNSKNDLV